MSTEMSNTETFSTVTLTVDDHIAHLTLNRPEKRNAVSLEMISEFVLACEVLMGSDARVVVLSGAGQGFCSGLDTSAFGALLQQDPNELLMPRTHGDANMFQQVALGLRALPMPVIAALDGVCFGAGFQLALGADIRIAAPDTRMSVMEMRWGLVPDMGGMVLMPALTGSDVIRRLTYTADEFDAAQMQRWGLVTELAEDPRAAALLLAQNIASNSPAAVRAAKRLIGVAETAERAEVLLAESREQAGLIGAPEQIEVVQARFQKRDPVFR